MNPAVDPNPPVPSSATTTVQPAEFWTDSDPVPLLARNVLSEYVAVVTTLVLGLVMLPFNVAHLGKTTYGLWVLATSITAYFDVLEMGYGSAQLKFTAQYRAHRDASALNEVTSTLFFVFLGIGTLQYVLAIIVSGHLTSWFNLDPAQAPTASAVLLIVMTYIAVGLPFSVFGSITNGFQRYYLNNFISVVTSVTVAVANAIVLLMGYGIVHVVATTTAIRLLSLVAYRASAYRAFPLLHLSWANVRRSRLREITAFSVFLLIIDIASKINFTADTMVIGAFLGTAAIAVWTVGSRIIDLVWQFTRVLSRKLFTNIVDAATQSQTHRSREMLIQGTRISLAIVFPIAAVTAVLAKPIVMRWVGNGFQEAVPVLQVLSALAVVRTGALTAQSVLKATDRHRLLAAVSVAMAVANLVLSIVFVRWLGLTGVALGTLIPAAAGSIFVIFPAACRAVELSMRTALRHAVWPAVWPAVPAALVLVLAAPQTERLWTVALMGAVSSLVYLAIFYRWALPLRERERYSTRVRGLLRRGALVPAL